MEVGKGEEEKNPSRSIWVEGSKSLTCQVSRTEGMVLR